jgi:hypothetical protein
VTAGSGKAMPILYVGRWVNVKLEVCSGACALLTGKAGKIIRHTGLSLALNGKLDKEEDGEK